MSLLKKLIRKIKGQEEGYAAEFEGVRCRLEVVENKIRVIQITTENRHYKTREEDIVYREGRWILVTNNRREQFTSTMLHVSCHSNAYGGDY
ncbi:MAG: hypothetical protein ACXABY_21160, partial [Candidatus Thorarchaeota archaeon]